MLARTPSRAAAASASAVEVIGAAQDEVEGGAPRRRPRLLAGARQLQSVPCRTPLGLEVSSVGANRGQARRELRSQRRRALAELGLRFLQQRALPGIGCVAPERRAPVAERGADQVLGAPESPRQLSRLCEALAGALRVACQDMLGRGPQQLERRSQRREDATRAASASRTGGGASYAVRRALRSARRATPRAFGCRPTPRRKWCASSPNGPPVRSRAFERARDPLVLGTRAPGEDHRASRTVHARSAWPGRSGTSGRRRLVASSGHRASAWRARPALRREADVEVADDHGSDGSSSWVRAENEEGRHDPSAGSAGAWRSTTLERSARPEASDELRRNRGLPSSSRVAHGAGGEGVRQLAAARVTGDSARSSPELVRSKEKSRATGRVRRMAGGPPRLHRGRAKDEERGSRERRRRARAARAMLVRHGEILDHGSNATSPARSRQPRGRIEQSISRPRSVAVRAVVREPAAAS